LHNHPPGGYTTSTRRHLRVLRAGPPQQGAAASSKASFPWVLWKTSDEQLRGGDAAPASPAVPIDTSEEAYHGL